MNNKKLGTIFERELVNILNDNGYWVHFISPNASGAQPFDIIAVKDTKAYAIDCKTCVNNVFNIRRLEDNQIFAFELWMKRGNGVPLIAIKHKDEIFMVPYTIVKENKNAILTDDLLFKGEF